MYQTIAFDEMIVNRRWIASPSTTTPDLIEGFRALTITGTLGALAPFTGFNALAAINFSSAAAAGSVTTLRHTTAWNTDVSTNYSMASFRFFINDAAPVANSRMFLGITNSTAALTNVDPATLTNCLGIGHNSGDTSLSIYACGAPGTGTVTSLGANFPTAAQGKFFDFRILQGTVSTYQVLAYGFGAPTPVAASGEFSTGGLNSSWVINGFRSNGSTALAASLAMSMINIRSSH